MKETKKVYKQEEKDKRILWNDIVNEAWEEFISFWWERAIKKFVNKLKKRNKK